MYFSLYKFLDIYEGFYRKQFAFRNSHSTSHAEIKIAEKNREALDKDEYACGIFLDFQKAFDTVNHKVLLDKRAHYRIRGLTLKQFQSCLANRK